MNVIILFFIIIFIVGFVTAGLKIQFDRFFAIILLIFLIKFSVVESVNVFLWIMLLSSIVVLWKNKEKIKNIPSQTQKKFFTIVPLLTLIGVFTGTTIFSNVSNHVLMTTLGILALLYGLRLMLIHFKAHELEYKNPKPIFQKMCGLLGPIVSGFFAGFIGTTLKPLKISFAVKVGRMNLSQVYIGNVITAFYASFFAIILHSLYIKQSVMTISNAFIGICMWIGIHFVYEATNLFFKDKWRKPFQILIGIILIAASFKFL